MGGFDFKLSAATQSDRFRLAWGGGSFALYSEWRISLIACLFVVGVAAYFSVGFEPTFFQVILCVGLLASLTYLHLPRWVILGCLVIVLGFGAAKFRSDSVAGAILPLAERYYKIDAQVKAIDRRPDKPLRLLLSNFEALGSLPEKAWPQTIRVTVRTDYPSDLSIGDRIVTAAVLKAPSRPLLPGGYDFSRDAWFKGIGGQGFAVRAIDIAAKAEKNRFLPAIERYRDRILRVFVRELGVENGGIAGAIFLGKRDAIPAPLYEDLKDAGLAHIVAISGLHMGLVGGLFFVAAEFLFALWPWLALRILPRKLAAGTAIIGISWYLLFSGMGPSAIRAYIMALVALIAILMDRRAISLRSVMIAALVILVLQPENLINAGFQMSFAATAALVVVFEYIASRPKIREPVSGSMVGAAFKKGLQFLLMTLLTTLVAELAILPIALFHFQEMSVIGLIANLTVMPILVMCVMPIGILCLLCCAVGMQIGPLFALLGAALSLLVEQANHMESWGVDPYKSGEMSFAVFAFIMSVFVLTLLLKNRKLAVLINMVSLPLFPLLGQKELPTFVVFEDGRSLAAYTAERETLLANVRASTFKGELAQDLGQGLVQPPMIKQCDPDGCRFSHGETRVVFAYNRDAARASCERVLLYVGRGNQRPDCIKNQPTYYLSSKQLKAKGAHAIWLKPTARVVTVLDSQGKRPWNKAYWAE